jgi:hypothetical protein
MDNPYSVELLAGGPGAPPQPWVVQGATIRYDGCVMVPSNVVGGNTGPGTINANALYVKGVQFVNPVGSYLPLTGGALTGELIISNPSALYIGGGQLGQALVTNGAGGLSWSSNPPGGPYLSLAGGTLSGPLTIPAPSGLILGGGQPGNVLSTNGLGTLAWVTPSGGGGGGASISISDTAPLSPAIGSLWWDSVGGQLYLWYSDVNSSQWVPTTNQFGGGYLTLSGGTLTGGLVINSSSGLIINDAAGTNRGFALETNTSPRWSFGASSEPETGSNAGSNYFLNRFDDTGTWIDTPFKVNRASGQVAIPNLNAQQAVGINRVLNGDMFVDQRNAGAGGTAIGYTCDRWQFTSSAAVGKGSWQRTASTIPSIGITDCPYQLQFTSSGAYTPAVGDYFSFMQTIEANFISDFGWGTPQAQPVTLSFWAYSNVVGTFSGTVRNVAGTRSYPYTYTISAANTWTRIVINVPPDTTGVWVLNGNAGAINLYFCFGAGTNFLGQAGAWTNGNFVGAIGQTNLVAANGNYFIFTGVKLEIGNVATPFLRQSLAKSVADCQRYYINLTSLISCGYNGAGGAFYNTFVLPVLMRANPTATLSGFSYSNGSALGVNSINNVQLMTVLTITATGQGYCVFNATFSADI